MWKQLSMAKSGSCDLDICKGPGHIPCVQVHSVAIVPHRRWQVPPEELWCTCLAERHPLAVGSEMNLEGSVGFRPTETRGEHCKHREPRKKPLLC